MKSSILLVLIFVTANLCLAQTAKRTITNGDLEKYRQARLKSEADYLENYKRLGMPSPEEIEQLEAKRKAQLAADAERIRAAQRAEYELQLRANEAQRQANLANPQIIYIQTQTGGGYYPYAYGGFVGGQVLGAPFYNGGGRFFGNKFGHGGFRSFNPLPPNVQLVRNAANSFPTVSDIHNQVYGVPLQGFNNNRGNFRGNFPRVTQHRGNFGGNPGNIGGRRR
jgi:hypothetical protein